MDQSTAPRGSALKIFIGIFAALVLAALMPFMLLTSGMVFIYPLIAVVGYVAFSPVVGVVSLLLDIAAAGVYMGLPGAVAFSIAFVIPSAITLRALKLKRDFATRVATAVIAQIAGIVLMLAYARFSLGKSLIEAFTEIFDDFLGLMNKESLDMLLAQIYSINGVTSLTSMQNVTVMLDPAQRASYVEKLTSDIRSTLAQSLPGALLTASYYTGLLSAFLSTVINRKSRQDDSYVPIAEWYTPYKITFGAIGMVAVSLVLFLAGVSFGGTVLSAVSSLTVAIFTVQAITSLERRMKAAGRKLPFRIIIIALAALILNNFMTFYGAYSAIIGTHGAVKQIRDSKNGSQE